MSRNPISSARIDDSLDIQYNKLLCCPYLQELEVPHVDGYMTTKEAAEKWGISIRQVQNHCKKGILPGVIKVNNGYLIPNNLKRPVFTFICESTSPNKK